MRALVYDVKPTRWAMCKVAGWVTPRVFWSRLGSLRLVETAIPSLPGAGWVRLKPILGGICGTDLAAIMQRNHPASILQAFASFPAILGHENVAEVTEIGLDVEGWSVGDRVVVEPSLSCEPRGIEPVCPQCARGRFALCKNSLTGPLPPGLMIGWNNFTGGSWSESFVAHASQVYRVPDSIDDDVAVLTDPVASALHGVLRHPPEENDTVFILGGGIVGISVAACVRALGYRNRVVALVRHRSQAEQMQRVGVEEHIISPASDKQQQRYQRVADVIGGSIVPTMFGHHAFIGGFDVVYDCIGSGESMTDALKYCRSGGTMVLVGTSQITLVDTAPLWLHEVNVVGANGRAMEDYHGRRCHTYEIVFDLIEQGKLSLDGLLTHRFGLSDYRKAFNTLLDRKQSGAIKVAIDPSR